MLETRFQLSLAALLVLLVLAVLQCRMLNKSDQRLKEVRAQQALVGRIDDMKKDLVQRIKAGKKVKAKPAEKLILQGTVLKSGLYHALINGVVYKKGESVSGYKIIEIFKNSAILENKTTKILYRLQISNLP